MASSNRQDPEAFFKDEELNKYDESDPLYSGNDESASQKDKEKSYASTALLCF